MKLFYSSQFDRSFADAPEKIQKLCIKQIELLARDLIRQSEPRSMMNRVVYGREG
jgi:hypothetical protein